MTYYELTPVEYLEVVKQIDCLLFCNRYIVSHYFHQYQRQNKALEVYDIGDLKDHKMLTDLPILEGIEYIN